MSIENNMWIEKYRPANIADVILPERIRAVIDGYLVKGEIPSLIFQSESPGTGKTTSARAIANHFGVKPLFINASVNNSIDDVRTTIVDYATSVSLFGGKKQHRIVILDECERISDAGQDALKGIIEQVSSNCRFILTANNFNRIIPALRSRCDEVDFNMNDAEKKEIGRLMFMHCQTILNAEGIPFQKEALAPLVMRYAPDNRTVLKKLQRFALQHGTIDSGIIAEMESGNLNDVIGFLKAKNFVGVRDWVFANADKVQSDVFRKMYRELDPIINPQTLPDLILILGEYQKHWAIVPDRLVHILAMMTEIMMRVQFKG